MKKVVKKIEIKYQAEEEEDIDFYNSNKKRPML